MHRHLTESWGQGLYAKEAMEDYAHFMLEEPDQCSRAIGVLQSAPQKKLLICNTGKSCDAMRRACDIFESKQSAFVSQLFAIYRFS